MSVFSNSATVEMVRSALGAATLKQAVHAHNIANANVEGFTPSKVRFEEQLGIIRDKLSRGELVSMNEISPVPESLFEVDMDQNQGKVALDTEVAELSKNALQYQALVKVLSRHLSLTATAIGTGGR